MVDVIDWVLALPLRLELEYDQIIDQKEKSMKKIFLTAIFCFVMPLIALAAAAEDSTSQIKDALAKTVVLWNQGDIDAFMQTYKNADSIMYISSAGVIKGYKNIAQNYHNRYPTKQKMGKLNFMDIEVQQLAPNYASVVGKWQVTRSTGDNVGGIFTLLYEKESSQWKIILDHTS
jgi:ketosteroid isomerase-like protein